jgi:hypothetical protein
MRLMLVMLLLAASPWQPLAVGVETRTMRLEDLGELRVVRVTPGKAKLALGLVSQERSLPRTAAEWLDHTKALAAINAGMYDTDLRSNVGHLHCGAHVNQARWSTQYQSALAFNPKDPKLPAFTMVDLDQSGARETVEKYDCVVQNLRLIRAPGENVWQPTKRKWSEAALALDKDGRLLLLFSRAPMAMDDYAKALLASDLNVVRAMHLDGAAPASLSVRGSDGRVDLGGDGAQQPLPNVLLVLGADK